MADIEKNGWGEITLVLSAEEAAYALACLGASNSTLFPNHAATGRSLYEHLRDTMEIPQALDVPDNKADAITVLFRRFSEVLDAWCGKRNFTAARKLGEEYGL